MAAAGSTSQAVWPPSPLEKGSGRGDQCLVPKVKRGLLALKESARTQSDVVSDIFRASGSHAVVNKHLAYGPSLSTLR